MAGCAHPDFPRGALAVAAALKTQVRFSPEQNGRKANGNGQTFLIQGAAVGRASGGRGFPCDDACVGRHSAEPPQFLVKGGVFSLMRSMQFRLRFTSRRPARRTERRRIGRVQERRFVRLGRGLFRIVGNCTVVQLYFTSRIIDAGQGGEEPQSSASGRMVLVVRTGNRRRRSYRRFIFIN